MAFSFKLENPNEYLIFILQLSTVTSLIDLHIGKFLLFFTFIDASNEFEKGKNQNKLTPDNIKNIIDTYRNRENVEKYSHVASLAEIKENDYNLNIPRYVDTFEEEEVIPLSEVAQELTEVKAEIESSYQSLFGLLNELEGTTDKSKSELSKFISLLSK